ncbi:MAG: hypothetical protein ACAH79_01935 [Thermoleophilia bacterium]
MVVLIGANDHGLKQAVANHTEGRVSIWNNGDGSDVSAHLRGGDIF